MNCDWLLVSNSWCAKLYADLLRQVQFGQSLKLVGDNPALGGWDIGRAPGMKWSNHHIWSVELDIKEGEELNFKVGLLGTTTDSCILRWLEHEFIV